MPDRDDSEWHVVQTDLTPGEVEVAQLRAIHDHRGHYYDATLGAEPPAPLSTYQEPTMPQLTIGGVRNSNADTTRYAAIDNARDRLVWAEVQVLLTIVDEELTETGQHYTARIRELLNLQPRTIR
jgi:hypothetical protein